MKEVLYKKNNVEVRCEYGDVTLYSDSLMIVQKDTPANRKSLLKIAEVKAK